jgi:hypothetical protein
MPMTAIDSNNNRRLNCPRRKLARIGIARLPDLLPEMCRQWRYLGNGA